MANLGDRTKYKREIADPGGAFYDMFQSATRSRTRINLAVKGLVILYIATAIILSECCPFPQLYL